MFVEVSGAGCAGYLPGVDGLAAGELPLPGWNRPPGAGTDPGTQDHNNDRLGGAPAMFLTPLG